MDASSLARDLLKKWGTLICYICGKRITEKDIDDNVKEHSLFIVVHKVCGG